MILISNMFRIASKWSGLPLFGLILLSSAIAIAEDVGPLPPPDGPFFSSKPLLYYGEEPEPTETVSDSSIDTAPPPIGRGYPMQNYPNFYGPSPYGAGRAMPTLPQLPAYRQGWNGQNPYYRYNPNGYGYPPFSTGRGYSR